MLEAQASRRYGRARFRLPPVVQHRHLECFLYPSLRLVIAMLASYEDGSQRLHAVLPAVAYFRIGAAYHAERGRHGEDAAHLVVVDDSVNGKQLFINYQNMSRIFG